MSETVEFPSARLRNAVALIPLEEEDTEARHLSARQDGLTVHSPVIVKLNVGGKKFTTSLETLCLIKASYFESMFSGRHCVSASPTDDDGSIFIDRDGTHFRHVLNFLRTGSLVSLPKELSEKEELAIEADYYGLEAMVRAIRMPTVCNADVLNDEIRSYRDQECALRARFSRRHYADTSPQRVANLYEGLVPLFHPDLALGDLPLQYNRRTISRDYTSAECFMELHKQQENTHNDGMPVTVKSLAEFQTNFNRYHPNVLSRLDPILAEEPIVVAGGAVLSALTGSKDVRTGQWWGKTSDIDLFVYCQTPEEANRIAHRVFYALATNLEQWVILRSRGVINMHRLHQFGGVETKVQLVLRLYDVPSEVLVGFDVDCCCCAYDGREVWLTARCAFALQRGVNVMNPLHAWPNKASYELRLAKYAARGFGVVVPGLDPSQTDLKRIVGSELSKLKGLARFIKVSFEMKSAALPQTVYSLGARGTELLETGGRPVFPCSLMSLRGESFKSMTVDEKLLSLTGSFYEEINSALIIPSVYHVGDGEGEGPRLEQWIYGDFTTPRESRDPAWREILNAPNPPEGVPGRLVDSWDSNKRSREYLNDEMDKFDLDSVYYSAAYKDE